MTAPIGHNLPPRERLSSQLDDLLEEARRWFDGSPCADQEHANDITQLLRDAQAMWDALEAERKTEAKPFDDGKAAVQAFYKPLQAKAEAIEREAKRTLAPWIARQQQAQREAEDAARREAEALAARAREVRGDGMVGAMAADYLLAEAAAKVTEAGKLARERAGAKAATGGRKITLRTVTEPVAVTDGKAALRWAMEARADALRAWLLAEARRALPARVPGVAYEDRETVR
jgi:hypothetical protein